jgi:ATP-dependent helicase IRC3
MSAATPTLRPYQREAVAAVMAARRAGVRRMVVCLPTGAGKTVILAKAKLESALGTAHVVALERGADRASQKAKVLVCSLRSLHQERLSEVLQGRDFGLVIYDECHHAAADDNLRILRQLGAFEPNWTGTLLGFTATTARGDGKGLDTVFERIVYTKTLPAMIEEGYLAKLRGFRVSTTADLSALSNQGLDFRDDELELAIDIEERNALVARSIQELARDRRTIAFCVTVNHARNLCNGKRRASESAARLSRRSHPGDDQCGGPDRGL